MENVAFNPEYQAREARWQRAAETVDSWYTVKQTERGEVKVGVDPEMRDILVALIALGLNTESSCWGHETDADNDEHINPSLMPYITVAGHLPDREYLPDEVASAAREAAEYHVTVSQLLEEFYRSRPVIDERVKIKTRYFEGVPSFRIFSVAEPDVDEDDDREVRQLLPVIHREWADFSNFLKQKALG